MTKRKTTQIGAKSHAHAGKVHKLAAVRGSTPQREKTSRGSHKNRNGAQQRLKTCRELSGVKKRVDTCGGTCLLVYVDLQRRTKTCKSVFQSIAAQENARRYTEVCRVSNLLIAARSGACRCEKLRGDLRRYVDIRRKRASRTI